MSLALLGAGLCLYGSAASGALVDPVEPYAWSESGGWLHFSATHGGVSVYSDHLEGYAWSDAVGWIKLGSHSGGGSHSYANSSSSNWGVNRDASGGLSGFAWSENAGWINFAPSHAQVTIDPATGRFAGYAWSEGIGWVHFKNAAPGYGVRHYLNGILQLTASYFVFQEEDVTVTFNVTRTAGSEGAASVNYATADGSAVAGSDYTSASGTLNWADGDADPKPFTITFQEDPDIEPDEIFSLTLSGVSGAELGAWSSVPITLADDDTPITLPPDPEPDPEPEPEPEPEPDPPVVADDVVNDGLLTDPIIESGATVTGGTLGGTVTNGGTVSDVELEGDTTIQGGSVSGTIEGSVDAPATLSDVVVEEGSTLSNVVVAGDSQLDDGVVLGEGVRFTDNELIPDEIDLTTALGTVGDASGDEPPAVDLSTDVVEGSAPLIEAVNEIPVFADGGLSTSQDSTSGSLELDVDGVHFAFHPTEVTQAPADAQPGLAITEDGLIEMVTAQGRRIVSQPTSHSPEELADALSAIGFQLTRAENGRLVALLPTATRAAGDRYFSARPGVRSHPAEPGQPLGVARCELPELLVAPGYCHTYAENGGYRSQPLWPAPADWEELKGALTALGASGVRMDVKGTIHFVLRGLEYRGHVGYEVEQGDGNGRLEWTLSDEPLDDERRSDLWLIYPNGDRQWFHLAY